MLPGGNVQKNEKWWYMKEEQKKFKARYFSIGYDNPESIPEYGINRVIDEEFQNGYEPISVSIDLSHGHMCVVLFKKVEFSKFVEKKDRYDSVVRMIKKGDQ